MIDLHCHILPGIDDGAKDWEESLLMAEKAVEEGITHILATPHHQNRSWINPKNKVIALVDELQERLNQANIDLTVFPGQEVRIHGDLLNNIELNEISFIDEFDKYLLIEFPTPVVPHYTEQLFFNLQSEGITPIIVHPERNQAILDDPSILKTFVDRGVMAQLTAGSYTGAFGKKIERLSEHFIEANLIHYIASDAHNTSGRTFYMRAAFEKLEKKVGQEKVVAFQKVSRALINGDPVALPTPKDVQLKRSFLDFFRK